MPIQGTVCNPNVTGEPVYKCEVSHFSRSGDIVEGIKNLNRSHDHNHAPFGCDFLKILLVRRDIAHLCTTFDSFSHS